jgi:hypothetical protein
LKNTQDQASNLAAATNATSIDPVEESYLQKAKNETNKSVFSRLGTSHHGSLPRREKKRFNSEKLENAVG